MRKVVFYEEEVRTPEYRNVFKQFVTSEEQFKQKCVERAIKELGAKCIFEVCVTDSLHKPGVRRCTIVFDGEEAL